MGNNNRTTNQTKKKTEIDANKSDSLWCQILKRNHDSPFQLSPNVSMYGVVLSEFGVLHFEGLNRKNARLRLVKTLPQTNKILTYLQQW